MTLKLGILGAGRIGRIHCDNLLFRIPHAQLTALCDPFLDDSFIKSKAIAHKYKSETDFWQNDFDAVVICSPSSKHVEQIKKAIYYGKHIFCEKPLSLSLSEHLEIAALLKEKPLQFQMGFNRRFDRDFSTMAQKMKNKDLGAPYYLKIISRDPAPPPLEYIASSGGLFFDMAIHDFDMARFLMQSDITEVYARGDCLVDQRLKGFNDIDTAITLLQFANNTFGIIDNSRKAIYGYDQRIEIFGSAGSLGNHNHRETTISKLNEMGTFQEKPLPFFLERYAESYELEMKAFVRCCLENQKASPSIEDSIQAVRVVQAANESLRANRPVRVSEE